MRISILVTFCLVVLSTNAQQNTKVLVKVSPTFNITQLKKVNAHVNTKAGQILSVSISPNNIQQLKELKGVICVEASQPTKPMMEIARKSARVDSLHQALALPYIVNGNGVVVGVIDAGFDYLHPTFFDTTGQRFRVKKVWEQHKTGTPPQGFSYGNELTSQQQMQIAQTDAPDFSHGTHVAGIAAGSGFGTGNAKYRGVAYMADLIFVGIKPAENEWKGSNLASIVDGINYIFKYADSVGKPAVVNISWGCNIGSKDGSSLFAQACRSLIKPSRLIVVSAGNNGDEQIHIEKQFTPTDTILNTFVELPTTSVGKRSWLDVWGEPNHNYNFELKLYNNGVTATTGLKRLPLIATDSFLVGAGNDTLFYTYTFNINSQNNKPHLQFDLKNRSIDSILLTISATSGKVHLFEGIVEKYSGYYGSLKSYNYSWATQGDNKLTIGEMASADAVIAVAAYVSKIAFRNLSNQQISYGGYAVTNRIAPFSSHGPTLDGRMKPDIAAPGMTIASAMSSFDATNNDMLVAKATVNAKDYFYGESSGTSMSAPMVSGIVALMLSVNPHLTTSQLRTIFKQTAITDNFTQAIPDSNIWGYGKINAAQAVLLAKQLNSSVNQIADNQTQHVAIYPNPNNGTFTIDVPVANCLLQIINSLGQLVASQNLTPGTQTINLHTKLASGLYWIKISNPNNVKWVKMVVE